jgi:integrase
MDFTDESILALSTLRPQQEFYDSSWKERGSFGVRLNRSKGERVFFLLYSVNGRRRRYPLGRFPTLSVDEARSVAKSVIERVRRGEDPLSLKKLRRHSVEQVFERFLASRRLAEKTSREYKRLFSREISPWLGSRRLDEISERELKRLLYILAEESEKPALSNRVRALLSAIFSFALDSGLCDSNPLTNLPPKGRERRESRIKKLASFEELYSIYEGASGLAGEIVRFSLLSGVSPSEVRGLRWSDIRGDFWESRRGYLINLTHAHRAILASVRLGAGLDAGRSEYVFSPPPKNITSMLKRAGANSFTPSELERSVQQEMLKLGIPFSEHSMVFGKLRPPEHSLREWAARKVFSEWAQLLTSPTVPEQGKVVRLRRLKRLK